MRILLLLVAAMLAGCAAESEPESNFVDSDGDGFSDEDEIVYGTDPNSANDFPYIEFEPVWGGEDAPIRPGAPIGWCTYNFLFFSPNGSYYIGTAAHCTDEIGQRMPLEGYGDIGTVVYDSDNATDGANADFSLVLLDEGLHLEANPRMMNHDGPVGSINPEEVAVGDVLEHHGYGMVFGDYDATRDRPGYFSGWSGGAGHDYCAESPIWWGDSGSPILHGPTSKALGIVSRAGWVDCVPNAQLMGASMPYIFQELGEFGWGSVQLGTV